MGTQGAKPMLATEPAYPMENTALSARGLTYEKPVAQAKGVEFIIEG